MKKFTVLLLFAFLSLFGFGTQLQAAPSASPYDNALDTYKTGNSTLDAILDSSKDVNKATSGKLAEYLKNTSIWKKLSEKAQGFIGNNIGKLGPLVKKLGWIANAVDLAPSVYNTLASFVKRDRKGFKKAFRETALKTASIIVGLGIGAAVTASIPLVVAGTAATGGALLLVAAGGAVVSVGGGMLADHLAKKWFSKSLENFGGKLYDKLITRDTLTGIMDGGGRSSGGRSGSGGAVTLDKLQW
jgi:hypothetical protein